MKKIFLTATFCLILSPQVFAQETNPDTVKIGCYVISLHDFDFPRKEYTARFWLWTLYKNPNINFENAVEIPNAKSIQVDETVSDSLDGKKWVQMKLKCVMKESWNIDNFPFDRQELHILVENSKYDVRSMVFVPDTVGKFYDPELTVEGWKIKSFKIETGVSRYATGFGDNTLKKPVSDYSKFSIAIELERNAWGLFLKLFLGMYVAFAISFVSFFIDPQHVDPRFGLPVGGLFASVGNKYVIDSYLPDTSTLTIVDILHALTFIFIFGIIAFSALSLRQEETGFVAQSKRTDRYVAWAMIGIYALVNAVLISLAILS
ncbi:MAG: hypothetical protein H7Y04_08780 [Verrucomicrobia bacterium]|nr:hypothetical protein [Cytophagales bacterium]